MRGTFTPSGENPAYTDYADTAPRAMSDHSQTMNPGVFEVVGKSVYQIFGYALASSDELQVNDDGSIDLVFGPAPPQGRETNWLQTEPDRGWFTYSRWYRPTQEFFDQTWQLPDLTTTYHDLPRPSRSQVRPDAGSTREGVLWIRNATEEWSQRGCQADVALS